MSNSRSNSISRLSPIPGSPQDLVIPSFKWPQHYDKSPYLGDVPQEKRDILMYFKARLAVSLDI